MPAAGRTFLKDIRLLLESPAMADSRQSAGLPGMFWTLAAFALLSFICGEGWRTARRDAARAGDVNRELSFRLSSLEGDVATLRRESGEYKAQAEKAISALEKQLARTANINHGPQAELVEQAGLFAVPQGEIRRVDPVGRRVWINLGEADGVKPRVTFSVGFRDRTRVHDWKVEMAVGPHDLKGAIEVTRVLEEHLSEARILSEFVEHPIAKGDPVYSPTWRRGQGEAFSVVGIVDLNGEGRDDRELLTKIIAASGGRIDNDVDGEGILHVNGEIAIDGTPEVTAATKFVVIGQIPELKDGDDPQTLHSLQELSRRRMELEATARLRGIRVIRLADFLKYLGCTPNGENLSGHRDPADKSSNGKAFSGGNTSSPAAYRK
jgi:hypothetical protein